MKSRKFHRINFCSRWKITLYDSLSSPCFGMGFFFFFLRNINGHQDWCNLAHNNQRVYNYDAKISPVIPIGWKSADTTSNGSANWINSGNKKAANDYYKARLASRFIWSPSLIGFSMPEELPIYMYTVFYTVCDYAWLWISQVRNKHSFASYIWNIKNIDFCNEWMEMNISSSGYK